MWLKATAGQTPQTDRCRIPYRTPNRSGRQEPMVSRIYVEKKPGFDVEAQQLKGELTEILGIKVPVMTIPVKPGRNLAIIIEVAAMNNRQKKMGYNAAYELLSALGMDASMMPHEEIKRDLDI